MLIKRALLEAAMEHGYYIGLDDNILTIVCGPLPEALADRLA